MKEQYLAGCIYPDCKNPSQAQDHKLDLPTDVARGTPERSFKVHNDKDRSKHKEEIKKISGPTERDEPGGSHVIRRGPIKTEELNTD
jgi:hypothetical protein